MENREYDLIVWGATGFTGALVAENLKSVYGTGASLRWAIAGRDLGKLEELQSRLGADDLDLIVADSFNDDALNDLARRTRVVITTVGPYAQYGDALVAACVKNGTHYCDLAGEAQWIRRMIDQHHDDATQTGAKIVHCCGFDSVPMDIGVYFLQNEAQSRHGEFCQSISMLVKATKGAASGGTIASMMNLIKEARRDKASARALGHPYGLNPVGEQKGPDGGDQRKATFHNTAGCWTAPFVMAGINTKVVRRSHALMKYPYGKDFSYHEAVMTGKGVAGWFKAQSVALSLGAFVLMASFGVTRRFMQRFILPKPGEGPDRNLQQSGFFDLRQFGTLPDGKVLRTRIVGEGDPGYRSTSRMLSECAVCLAKDELAVGGGVWTPAAAMGQPLLERLQQNAGLTFELLER